MELRTLEYFLAVAREESMSGAAEVLHVTQPTLSRQMKALEDELGVTLFQRTNRSTLLTADGMHLKQRAEEILSLLDRTTAELQAETDLYGDIRIGAAETDQMRRIVAVMKKVRILQPGIRFRITSGNADDILFKLEHGLIDFALVMEPFNKDNYNCLNLPDADAMGLVMRREDPMAAKDFIEPADLRGMPLLVSSRETNRTIDLISWSAGALSEEELNIIGSYNLIFNAMLIVESGIANAVCIDHLIPEYEESPLVFRPFHPEVSVRSVFIWKKYHFLTPPAEFFLDALREDERIKKNQHGQR